MEVEVQIMTPSPATSTNATPYTTAPSSPHRFPTFFYSAPTSPIHALVGFQQDIDTDFAFNFTGNPQSPSISAADELFQAGKIKPLKPVSDDEPKFNSKTSNSFTEAFSQTPFDQTQSPPKRGRETTTRARDDDPPRRKNKNLDSFTEGFSQTPGELTQNQPKRGRETSRSRDKLSGSSSPFRISDILSDEENNSSKNTPNWYSKWNIKNLILFRSVSEGSATARRRKDPVNRYTRITRKGDEDVKNLSGGSGVGVRVGTSRKVSAHEMHYTANRAVAEEMRRKTYLPYKSGLFGCFNGANSVHHISKGITSVVMKQR